MKKPNLSIPSTFSVVARDPENGDMGVIVQSKFPAVGALVPWAIAGVGAVATQAWVEPAFGPWGLEHMLKGKSAEDTMKELINNDDESMREHRQFGLVDAKGRAAAFTGKDCMEWAGHIVGDGFACQGNILTGEDVVTNMAEAYEKAEGDIVDKLFAALNAGQAAGGDKRGMQSAAIYVVRERGCYGGVLDRWIDVRVDEHSSPIEELERVFQIYDMTLLSREDPSRLRKLQGDLAIKVQKALQKLGLVDSVTDDEFPEKALEKFMGISNFENKMRDDGTIWQSVLEYMFKEAEMEE
ncbi:MAG: DUF1028 domain-containing protein [Candidatus Thorarchaeota archaeon]